MAESGSNRWPEPSAIFHSSLPHRVHPSPDHEQHQQQIQQQTSGICHAAEHAVPFLPNNNGSLGGSGGAVPLALAAGDRARSFVDSVMFPFLSCVNPELFKPTEPSQSKPQQQQQKQQQKNRTVSSTPEQSPSFVSPAKVRQKHSGRTKPAIVSPPDTTAIIWQPGEHDVLCGRGYGRNSPHGGNVRFRQLVASQQEYFSRLTKKQKMMLARMIVDLIRSVGGRFLARDTSSGGWCDIGWPRAQEKTAQALREQTPTKGTNNGCNYVDRDSEADHQTGAIPFLMDTAAGRSNSGFSSLDKNMSHIPPSSPTLDRESSSSSSSTANSSRDNSQGSPTNSEVTARMANYSPDQKLVSGQPLSLILPAHLQALYGPALVQQFQHQDQQLQHHPFFRATPRPMPCADFRYNHHRPMTSTLMPQHDWRPYHMSTLPPSSSLRSPPIPRQPPQRSRPTQTFYPYRHPTPYPSPNSPMPFPASPLPPKYQVRPTERDQLNDSPNGSKSPVFLPAHEISPPREQVWKKPRTQNEQQPNNSMIDMEESTLPSISFCMPKKSCEDFQDDKSAAPSSCLDCSSASSPTLYDLRSYFPTSKLSVQDRVIGRGRSCSSTCTINSELVPPSRLSGRQSRSFEEHCDGSAALSTAAFLLMDEEEAQEVVTE